MDDPRQKFPEDDQEIEFIDLDSNAPDQKAHELHLSPRARIWMIFVTIISAVLLLALTFGNYFSLLLPRQPPPRIELMRPSPVSLQGVMNGIVYAIDPDRMVYAIRASNGALIWQSFYANATWSTSSNGVTYTMIGGRISASKTKDNTLLWQASLPISAIRPLTVDNGHLYVIGQNNTLYTLNTSNGSLQWHYRLHTPAALPVAASGGFVYISTIDGTLSALRASNGSLLWHSQPSSSISQLLPTNDEIIYAADQTLTALHGNTGSIDWHLTLPARPVQPVVLTHNTLYLAAFDGAVYAFQSAHGSLLWHHDLPSLAYEPMVVSDGIAYIRATNNMLYTLNTPDGSSLWSQPIADVLSFAVVNGVAYIATTNGRVEAFQSSHSSLLWQHRLSSSAIRPLIVTNGVIYTGSTTGTIYAIRTTDSTLLWRYATQVE